MLVFKTFVGSGWAHLVPTQAQALVISLLVIVLLAAEFMRASDVTVFRRQLKLLSIVTAPLLLAFGFIVVAHFAPLVLGSK